MNDAFSLSISVGIIAFGLWIAASAIGAGSSLAWMLLGLLPVTVRSSAPVIPAEHSARLIALGYMVYLASRLRMTTPGRVRIYAGQLAD